MKLLFVADLHYALRQFDWLAAQAANYDLAVIGGDLLDLGSVLDLEVAIKRFIGFDVMRYWIFL